MQLNCSFSLASTFTYLNFFKLYQTRTLPNTFTIDTFIYFPSQPFSTDVNCIDKGIYLNENSLRSVPIDHTASVLIEKPFPISDL